MEAAEPEDRAEEEKRVESKSGERKRENMGSEKKVSRNEVEGGGGEVAVVGVVMVVGVAVAVGDLNEESL